MLSYIAYAFLDIWYNEVDLLGRYEPREMVEGNRDLLEQNRESTRTRVKIESLSD